MLKLKCENCDTEYIFEIKEIVALVCEACGGRLTITEEPDEWRPRAFYGGWKPPGGWDLVGLGGVYADTVSYNGAHCNYWDEKKRIEDGT